MKKLITLMILVTALITSACGNDSATSNSALKVMLESNVVSLDTSQATDVASFEVIADCIDGLLQSDAAGKPIPAIAESFEVSDDGLTYTFHLRDAKWSNGDPVTAGDFVFAWRRHCQQAQEYAYMMGSTVACVKNADAVIKGADPATLGVSAPDDKTFIVQLDTPVTFFPSLMCFPTFYPINEKFYNSLNPGTYGTTPDTFLSNGAFVLTDYLPGAATIQLNKNDNYWNASSINLSGLQYQVVTSSDNALTAFKTGTLDIVQISGNQVTHVKEDPNLVKSLQIMPAGSLTYLSFNEDPKNHHAGALANADLRLAVSNAIDRESLVNNYVITGAKALYTVIPLDFAANINTGEYFSADQSRYTELVGYNVSKARQHLQAAMTALGKNDIDLNLLYSNDSGDTTVKVAQAIKSQVEDALPNVHVTLSPCPKAEYLDKVTSNNYDIAIVNWIPDYDDPMTYLSLWTTDGCEVAEHWSDAAYDGIIENCTRGTLSTDYTARWDAMYDAEKILLEQAVVAPLYSSVTAALVSDKVSGVEWHSVGVDRVFKAAQINR